MTTSKADTLKINRRDMMENIRNAAITEFSQHGFNGTSTQAIAQRAGLKKSQLHYYIVDKESLYADVLSIVFRDWANLITFDTESMNPVQVLTQYIRQKLEFSFTHPELSRIFTTELLSGAQRLEAFWPDAVINTRRKVDLINSWVAEGLLRKLDGRLLLMHIWAMTQYYADYAVQAELVLEASLLDPQTRESIFEELVDFILLGCGLSPSKE